MDSEISRDIASDFDKAAANYDLDFTNSVIGKAQRAQVYRLLSDTLKQNPSAKILEINCGTGADALWISNQHFSVIATDISTAMIAAAKQKTHTSNLQFIQADINELAVVFADKKFDLIFSNFGGLNCLSENQMQLFFKNASRLLNEHGQLALVLMPRQTKWEQLYFLAKADFKNAFRRKSQSVIADVSGQKVTTYYYNPKEVLKLSATNFLTEQVRPIGFFLPPSYLEPFFKNKKNWFDLLQKFENRISNLGFLSSHADHYLISLRKR